MPENKGFLDNAYGLDNPAKTREFYRKWAETYEAEMRDNGYTSPKRVAAAMAVQVTDKSKPLLDLGCGTGLSGVALTEAGFTIIDGSDFSAEMLAAAESKDVYRALTRGDLNDPIPGKPGEYANITAVGVFSPGHAPPEMIGQVLDLLPAGGCFGFTLNDHALDEKIYEQKIEKLAAEGSAEIAFEEYGDHLPGHDLKAKVIVLRKS